MYRQILLNLLIAFIWMFLHEAWNLITFFGGYLLGIFLIFFLRRFFPEPFYVKKIWASIKLVLIFVRELFKSGLFVLKEVIRPTLRVKPGIFRLETQLKSDWEITLLSCLLTLTPGSVVLETAEEEQVLYIHALDVAESEQVVMDTIDAFERAIMEVTR